ncbi:MAG: response regulator [Eubacterium sp.]|nr:response regulator [Eubacterium sp.]
MKKNILMIDDNIINSEMIEVMLGDCYNVKFAADGEKGLAYLNENSDISLILLDLIMPNMGGIAFLMEVKKNPELKDIPVIVLTSDEDSEAECLSLGAVDFIKKPFPPRSVLLARIENALNSSKSVSGHEVDSYINALFEDYQTVYLVDATTGKYEFISTDDNILSLGIEKSGEGFFEKINETINKNVCDEDFDKVAAAFEKDNLLASLRLHHGLTLDYKIKINGSLEHYHLKAMIIPEERPQIVIGITNNELKAAELEKLKSFCNDTSIYSDVVRALTADYFCIYLVHLASDCFVEYSADDTYKQLGFTKSGENFFAMSLKYIFSLVHPEDTEAVIRSFTKENILKAFDKGKSYFLNFRMNLNGNTECVTLKASKLIMDGEKYLVLAINTN